MKHVELLSGVLASKHHDGLLPARVLTLQRMNIHNARQSVHLRAISVGHLPRTKSARSTRPSQERKNATNALLLYETILAT
jgi:hypothetical protein